MPTDIYYAPKEGAPLFTLAEVHRRFVEAGIACTLEPDADNANLHWIAFEPPSITTICASIEDQRLVFATLHAAHADDPEFIGALDQILESLGLSSGDEM